MHHSSYRAWVRHNGTHSTKTIKYKCWNTELVASLNHVLTPYWVSFDSEAENDIVAISTKLQDYLNRFEQAAKGRPCALLVTRSVLLTHSTVAKAPQSLKKNLTARRRLIETAFDDGIEDFMRGFRCAPSVLSEMFLLTPFNQAGKTQWHIGQSYILHVILHAPSLPSCGERQRYVNLCTEHVKQKQAANSSMFRRSGSDGTK